MNIEDWGEIGYQAGVQRQLLALEQVAAGDSKDTLVFCTHPPVVTLGRGTPADDILSWKGETVKCSRGGRATYHGPGQLIVYPIVDLRKERTLFRSRDVLSYLRFLENLVIDVLDEVGIVARVRSDVIKDDLGQELQTTGVWVKDKKIASIGIGVRKWVSYHGIAINSDDRATRNLGIKPCGFSPQIMTSVKEILGETVDLKRFFRVRSKYFLPLQDENSGVRGVPRRPLSGLNSQ